MRKSSTLLVAAIAAFSGPVRAQAPTGANFITVFGNPTVLSSYSPYLRLDCEAKNASSLVIVCMSRYKDQW